MRTERALYFVTWPNDTIVMINETVKFRWLYEAKDMDVHITWGTSKPNKKVRTFHEVFFTARNYEENGEVVGSLEMPPRYRGRVEVIGQGRGDATMQIRNVTLGDEGSYLCEITDAFGGWDTLSRAVTLHVLGE